MDLTAEIMARVEAHIPRGFFVRLMEEYELDYSSAEDFCLRRYDREMALDLIPFERRARNETSLVHVADEFAHRGIRASVQPNITNSNFHAEVVAGPVVITSSFVQQSRDLVRMAEFRATLARNKQGSLVDLPGFVGERHYYILLHGNQRIGKRRYHGTLGFFELAAPNEQCNAYLTRPINLARRYANDDVDETDVKAALERGFRYEHARQPSALLREYRKLLGYGS